MDHITRRITNNLVNKLPDNENYFKLSDLSSYGNPSFVVDRIKVELERNLADSIVPPQTDWADMETDAVKFAWNQFVRAIRAESRLPASYAQTVLETSVADIMDILVQPRKNIPEILYGPDDPLSFEEMRRRSAYIVVYTYFASALPRYMQKKELDELPKEKCAQIIARIDERLTLHYTPLNWAQLLEPWFEIIGDEIETELLRLFFTDKERPKIARLFEEESEPVNRRRLIEILSSPDLSLKSEHRESAEAVQNYQVVKEDEKASDTIQQEVEAAGHSEAAMQEAESKLREARQKLESEMQQESEFHGKSGDTSIEQEKKEEQPSPYESTDYEFDDAVKENDEDEDETPLVSSASVEEEEDEEEAEPMWKRFMYEDEDEDDEYNEEEPLQDKDNEEEDEDTNLVAENRSQRLLAEMRDSEDLFVEDIFEGNDDAYFKAMDKLASFTDWQSAGRFLHQQIFSEYDVDIYDEAAVELTDRLQNFFSEA